MQLSSILERSRALCARFTGIPGQLPESLALAVVATSSGSGGMVDQLGPTGVGLVLAFLILSLAVHEAAHAFVANLCGDSTAKDLGRMTLNPIVHIDLFMTVLLPLMMFMTAGFAFGGAKPVPVNYNRLRNPLRDMTLVALAGPVSNYLLSIVFFSVWSISVNVWEYEPDMLLPRIMEYSGYINLVLAIFNMIPVPPLDGSRVMTWLLPASMRPGYVGLERFGFMIVILLLMTGVFRVIMGATIPPLFNSVNAIVELLVS